MSAPPIRVYLSGPAFHLRPGNTDWQYLHLLTRLPEFAPGLTVHRERASWRTLAFNLRYAAGIAARRLSPARAQASLPALESTLSPSDLRRSRSDLVYAYGYCPVNSGPLPLVFHTGAVDRARLAGSGLTAERIEAFLQSRRRIMSAATLLTANSQAALDNLAEIAPEARKKMRLLPFFLPYLATGEGLVDENSIRAKFRQTGPMRLLFVGREARRKGLPEVLDAFKALDARLPGALELTVVSSLSDGEISIPRMPNLTRIAQLDREAVQLRMRESHFLLMPSHFEGYGWVYLEAMAAGAVPVASDAPIQREILANGAAGVLAAPDAARLEAALLPLLNHKSAIEQLAVQAWKRCREHYLPKPVAKRMSEVFEEAKEIGAR